MVVQSIFYRSDSDEIIAMVNRERVSVSVVHKQSRSQYRIFSWSFELLPFEIIPCVVNMSKDVVQCPREYGAYRQLRTTSSDALIFAQDIRGYHSRRIWWELKCSAKIYSRGVIQKIYSRCDYVFPSTIVSTSKRHKNYTCLHHKDGFSQKSFTKSNFCFCLGVIALIALITLISYREQ